MSRARRSMIGSGSASMPLHAAQEVVYFDQLRDPSCAKYNIGGYIRIQGGFDPQLFGEALACFSRANPQERIEISAIAGVPHQRQAPFDSLAAPGMLDFPSMDHASAWMQSRMDCPFDMRLPPLSEHALLRVGERDVLYFARYHHVVADAYSFALKIRTVLQLYLRMSAGETVADLPSADAAFRGEVDDCGRYLASAEHAADELYWTTKYSRLPPPVWPDIDATADAAFSAEASVELPEALSRSLLALARDTGVSPAHVLLGVVACHVRRSTGADDFVVGVPIHNRVYRRQKSLFGMFTTIMPSRVRFGGIDTFRALLRSIGLAQNADMAHRRYPFTQLARQLRKRDARRQSLFDVAVNFERFVPWPAVPDLQVSAHELASRQEDIPLHVKLCDFDGHQAQLLKVACSSGMLAGRPVEDVAEELLAGMAELVAHPDAPLQPAREAGASADYWRRSLHDAPPAPELPLDRPRSRHPAAAMHEVVVPLPAGWPVPSPSVTGTGSRERLALLLAAWSLLQCRLGNEPDVVSGLAVDAKVLPLRVRIKADDDVAALLRATASVVSDGLANAAAWDGSPESLVSPLRAVLCWHASADLPIDPSIDVRLSASETADGFALRLGYAVDRIDPETAHRWAGHLNFLLESLGADPLARTGDLLLLDTAQQRDLIEGFNATRVAYPDDAVIHALFEAQAERTPDAIALEYEGRTLTYAQLNQRANRLAHALRGKGVGPDRLVAICADRSIALVVAMLAVLKAGGAYVPLDPAYPAERLRHMLDDADPVLVLAQAACRGQLPGTAAPVWLIEDEASHAAQPASNPEVPALGSRNLAYVIFTSGSTGRPKGVMVEHRSVVRLVVNSDFAPLAPGACVAQCASPAFDATTWEVWGTLLHGARLLLVSLASLLSPIELNHLFRERGVTALFITVALYNQYVEPMAEAFGRLDYLLVGGDVLDPRTVGALVNSAQAPRWFKACYGPTEATTFASMHAVAQVTPGTQTIPLGKPIANTTILVLDEQRRPAPIGVRGELYIGGPGVARGYLKQPELTALKFIPDPFSDEPHARLYRTGDLGCWRPDGTIEFKGRNDHQVKIRGFRVEPGEVEAQLLAKAPIASCAVLALDGMGGNKFLAAWVVPAGGGAGDCEPLQLRALLSASMPDYLVPRVIVVVDALPLTANGKIDRAALRAMGAGPVAPSASYVPPETATQRLIASMWAELLGIERIGLHDDVWTLGWHSLVATQGLARLRETFQVELPFRALLESSTVAQAAEAVARACRGLDVADAIAELAESVMAMSDGEARRLLGQVSRRDEQAEPA